MTDNEYEWTERATEVDRANHLALSTAAGEAVPTTESEIERVAREIRQHANDNPRHGYDCSCMATYVRQVRELLKPLLPHDLVHKMSPVEQRAQRSFQYILNRAHRGAC